MMGRGVMKNRLLTSAVMVLLLSGVALGCGRSQGGVGGSGEAPGGPTLAQGKEPGKAGDASAARAPILLVVPKKYYQEEEYGVPRKLFEEAGYKVLVASSATGNAEGAAGGSCFVDLTLEEATAAVKDYSAVLFIGGPGSSVFHEDEKAHALVRKAAVETPVVGAICLAPYTLAFAGVLKGINATAWTGGRYTPEMFAAQGPIYKEGPVVVDGKFVTANGPRAAEAFAKAVLEALRK